MQEDKEAFFDAYDTVKNCLHVFTEMLLSVTFHPDTMEQSAKEGFTNATDLADYLVGKGLPFRDAHRVSGTLVKKCLREKRNLDGLSLAELQQESALFDADVYAAISLMACVSRRSLRGGTAPGAVEESIRVAEQWLAGFAAEEQK